MFRFPLLHCLCGTLAYRIQNDGEATLIMDRQYTGARFIDATEIAGLDATKAESSFGANLVDVDKDGDLDLYLAQGEHTNRLFLNTDGQGHFVESTDESGLTDPSASRGGMFADLNGDGNVDLYQLGAGVPNRLYFGDGAGHFIRQFNTGLEDAGFGQTPILGDVDGDGDIDIFYLNGDQSNTLFLNIGSGEFRNATEAAGLTSSADASAFHCQFADMDSDGDLDLYISNTKAKNAYYVNDGTGKFVDRAEEAGVAGPADQNSAGFIIGDFNGDGHLDLFTNSVGVNFLYMNDGTGSFTDQTEAAGLGNVGTLTLSVNAADFDGDGDLDIVQGRIEFGWSLYENDGNGVFTDVSSVSGINRFHAFSHAVAVGDVDGDGDLDVYLNSWDFTLNLSPNSRLLIQEGEPAYNWLKVRPVKEHGHPAFVGAQVRLFVAGTQTPASVRRHADGGHSFGGQDSGDVYFGLGQFPENSFDIEVRCGGPWITKATQPSLGEVAPNQVVEAICPTA